MVGYKKKNTKKGALFIGPLSKLYFNDI